MKRRSIFALIPLGLAAQTKTPAPPAGADAKAIAAIEKAGGQVIKIAQDDERLEVNLRLGGSAITDEQVALVRQLHNVLHLNLANTAVTDAGLAAIKDQKQLTELHLEQTKITDKGIATIRDLKNLQYLNLYGTAVSDAGLDQLRGLTNLKHLYVWQTKITEAGTKKFKAAVPGVDIVGGWELPAEPKK